MKNNSSLPHSGIYAITDCLNLTDDELLKKSENILNTGVALFQYRNKEKNKPHKNELALKLQALCKHYTTLFIINDDIELAKDIDADGVHLGKNDADIEVARKILGRKIIGISCYNVLSRALDAEKSGADYVAFGSCFPSLTKPDATCISMELIKQAQSSLSIPIVAIGGITPENGGLLVEANINYLAVISGLYSAADTIKATQSYNNLFK